jgi:hypothetical protein
MVGGVGFSGLIYLLFFFYNFSETGHYTPETEEDMVIEIFIGR